MDVARELFSAHETEYPGVLSFPWLSEEDSELLTAKKEEKRKKERADYVSNHRAKEKQQLDLRIRT